MIYFLFYVPNIIVPLKRNVICQYVSNQTNQFLKKTIQEITSECKYDKCRITYNGLQKKE